MIRKHPLANGICCALRGQPLLLPLWSPLLSPARFACEINRLATLCRADFSYSRPATVVEALLAVEQLKRRQQAVSLRLRLEQLKAEWEAHPEWGNAEERIAMEERIREQERQLGDIERRDALPQNRENWQESLEP